MLDFIEAMVDRGGGDRTQNNQEIEHIQMYTNVNTKSDPNKQQ